MWQQVGIAKANALCVCVCVQVLCDNLRSDTPAETRTHTQVHIIYLYIYVPEQMCKLSRAKTMKNPPKNKTQKHAQHQQRIRAQVRDREERESRRLTESGINRWIHQYQSSNTCIHTYIVYLSLYSATKAKHCKRMQNKFAFAFCCCCFHCCFAFCLAASRLQNLGDIGSPSARPPAARCA